MVPVGLAPSVPTWKPVGWPPSSVPGTVPKPNGTTHITTQSANMHFRYCTQIPPCCACATFLRTALPQLVLTRPVCSRHSMSPMGMIESPPTHTHTHFKTKSIAICSPLRGRIKGTATQINPVLPYFRGNTSIAPLVPPQSDN